MKFSLIFLFITLIYTSYLKKLKINKASRLVDESLDQYLERMSYSALQRISEGLLYLADETSCKVTGKYILLIIANIQRQKDRKSINFLNNTSEDINIMKNLLKKGKIIQIEFYPNHHIILFAKNTTHLYELQAFQNIYQLKDWMRNLENIKAKNINEFFNKVEKLIDNKKNNQSKFNNVMLDLFMPNYFINDSDKVASIKKWFKYFPYCKIVRADAVDYDFTNDPLDPKYFQNLFNDVDQKFLLRINNKKSWYNFLL